MSEKVHYFERPVLLYAISVLSQCGEKPFEKEEEPFKTNLYDTAKKRGFGYERGSEVLVLPLEMGKAIKNIPKDTKFEMGYNDGFVFRGVSWPSYAEIEYHNGPDRHYIDKAEKWMSNHTRGDLHLNGDSRYNVVAPDFCLFPLPEDPALVALISVCTTLSMNSYDEESQRIAKRKSVDAWYAKREREEEERKASRIERCKRANGYYKSLIYNWLDEEREWSETLRMWSNEARRKLEEDSLRGYEKQLAEYMASAWPQRRC
jgi:hypothetical protein